MRYIVGTRGSRLSIAQTSWVIGELKKANPDAEFEIKTITTKGDTDARPLFTINQKGIFEKEVDKAVAQKTVDFAVHSLKDVPSDLGDGLVIACIPKREAVNDVLITVDGANIKEIKKGAIVGTSSLRRAVQATKLRPDIVVRPIRGNIETRINKIGRDFDAVILAQAGLSRLGLDARSSALSVSDFAPSPGQGALAIVARSDDQKTIAMLKKIEDGDSRLEIEAERTLSRFVDSGCRFPVGAYAKSNGSEMSMRVVAFSVDGKRSIVIEKKGDKRDPASLGKVIGEELRRQGVEEMAINWRQKVEEWNKQ